jgi:transposase-like protein
MEVGPIPDGHEIRHKCDNPGCCNPAHLETGTHRQNILDTRNRVRGRNQVLSLQDAVLVRRRYFEGGERQGDIAREFGVTLGAINNVVRGRTFSELGTPTKEQLTAANAAVRYRPTSHERSQSLLSPDQVRAIRAEYARGGATQRAIAERFGVSAMVINRVINGKAYADVS